MDEKKLSKIGLFLGKRYDVYVNEKKNLMNHPRIVEYLFNKPNGKVSSINDLLIDYDSSLKIVRLEKKDSIAITSYFFVMTETLKRYSIVSDLYEKNIKNIDSNKKKILKQPNYLPRISTLSTNEKKVMDILNKLEFKYRLSFIHKWNFTQEGEHVNILKKATINYEQNFVYDFYGILINHGQLIQIVIECSESTQTNDLVKQYILFQMNVNLLRLNAQNDIYTQINAFLKKIKNTTKYIIHNPIKPHFIGQKIIFDNATRDNLHQFLNDYHYNHIIYLKNPSNKNPLYDSDDDEFFDNQIIDEINDDEQNNYLNQPPHEQNIIINANDFKKILKEKENYIIRKNNDAENIIVELIGKNK